MTNREAFIKCKTQIKDANKRISDSEIYRILMKASNYNSYTECIKNFDEEIVNLSLFQRGFARVFEGEPLQYVLEEAPFIDLDLNINRSVLIPRPETEGLVLLVQKLISDNNIKHDVIGDVCTGSGCIALYMKYKYKDSKVYASDKYQDAIEVATSNARKHNFQINFLTGDKLEPFIHDNIKLDVMISNPPYVEKMEDIEDNVKNYEPMYAIYCKKGVEFYEDYFKNYKKIMNKQFLMAFEINYDQEELLKPLIGQYFKDEDTSFIFLKDIYGKTRYLFILGGYDVKYFQR